LSIVHVEPDQLSTRLRDVCEGLSNDRPTATQWVASAQSTPSRKLSTFGRFGLDTRDHVRPSNMAIRVWL
jgi:hypothetical protein